ncbi:MAG: MoaD/ThiS family protein [Candidatus Thorarchaeota archaeon]
MESQIKIIFHGHYRTATKKREIVEQIKPGQTTIGGIIKRLADEYGSEFNGLIDYDTEQISNDALIMVNGKGIRSPQATLQHEDIVVFTVPIGGGIILSKTKG